MVWALLCCLPEQKGQQGRWQTAWWHVSSRPHLRGTARRQTNAFYSRKCRSLPECCGIMEGWEQQRILKCFGEKYKPPCFLRQSKWVHFYFCLGGLFLAIIVAKWYWISFSLYVGLMMEQCLVEGKPYQGETNKSESFEAVHILGHFRETVFFQSWMKLEVSPLWFL